MLADLGGDFSLFHANRLPVTVVSVAVAGSAEIGSYLIWTAIGPRWNADGSTAREHDEKDEASGGFHSAANYTLAWRFAGIKRGTAFAGGFLGTRTGS